jgi:hypothetical protein
MNRRHCSITALLMIMGIGCVGARGEEVQPVPVVVTIPPAEYTAPTTAGIKPFVESNVTNLLVDADPALQAKARDNLVQAASPNATPASPAFLFEYGKQLDAAFLPHLAPAVKASLRQRLNIAIVSAKVAAVADNSALQSSTLWLLDDKSEPVVLWALRAAQPQIAAVLKVNAGAALPPLVKAIKPAVLKHDKSGPIFDEGYQALNVSDNLVVNELMTLWEHRLKQYQGKAPPQLPSVDYRPVYTMTTATMWNNVILNNKNLQTRIMQDLSDQLALAGQWGDRTGAGALRDQLVQLVGLSAGGCIVVGGHQKIPALVAAAGPASKINPTTFPAGSKLKPMVDPIVAGIAAAFGKVQPPPMIAAPGGLGQPAVPGVQPAANQH